jgi:UDP-N-acetylglucosamine--N-acetylmuramyl-(pentapeptide) pyrophosphoryl-undecaprenol N-acetylglucosamine transferase
VYPALAIVERIGINDRGSGNRNQGSTIGDQKAEGHPFAALPLFEPATRGRHSATVLWIGGEGGVEQTLVDRAGIPFAAIPAGGLHGVGLWRSIRNATKLIAGTWHAWRLAGKDRPAAMLTTGGFVSGPVAVACWLRRVPILLYLPDIEPGLAVKFVARFARTIGVTTEDSTQYFPARKVIVTGYPTRSDLAQTDRAAAIHKFDLVEERQTLLVFGGSKGARSINRAIGEVLESLLAKYQVIHISGAADAAEVQTKHDALPDELKRHYHVFEYVHEMGFALAAVDLVVSRAGASILGEYPLFGLPSILVPYPYAWRYQKVNADYLAARGAAIRLDDETVSETLGPTIERVLSDAAQLQSMSRAARSLARPDPAVKLAQMLQELAA